MFEVKVQPEPFDLAAEYAKLSQFSPRIGAIVSFTGQVRDEPLLIEHWPGVAEQRLQTLLTEAARRWPLIGGTLVHRHGALAIGAPIVLVLTASAHRQPAFDAANYLMDQLKTDAPFWKKAAGGWVEARPDDSDAARRWAEQH